jgi:hypothetical protein
MRNANAYALKWNQPLTKDIFRQVGFSRNFCFVSHEQLTRHFVGGNNDRLPDAKFKKFGKTSCCTCSIVAFLF